MCSQSHTPHSPLPETALSHCVPLPYGPNALGTLGTAYQPP
jgi:hypothetical protein